MCSPLAADGGATLGIRQTRLDADPLGSLAQPQTFAVARGARRATLQARGETRRLASGARLQASGYTSVALRLRGQNECDENEERRQEEAAHVISPMTRTKAVRTFIYTSA